MQGNAVSEQGSYLEVHLVGIGGPPQCLCSTEGGLCAGTRRDDQRHRFRTAAELAARHDGSATCPWRVKELQPLDRARGQNWGAPKLCPGKGSDRVWLDLPIGDRQAFVTASRCQRLVCGCVAGSCHLSLRYCQDAVYRTGVSHQPPSTGPKRVCHP